MEDCIFCKITRGDIQSEKVFDGPDFIAIKDIEPKAPVHILIVPKKHVESLKDIDESDGNLLGNMMLQVKRIANEQGIAESGFKVLINNGKDAGQEVPHLHIHLMGGVQMDSIL